MSEGFTPGPWELIGDAVMADPRSHLPDTMLGIANMQDHGSDRPLSVHKANARLIAAAPDLLEALEATNLLLRTKRHACENNEVCHVLDVHISRNQAAILKARGTA